MEHPRPDGVPAVAPDEGEDDEPTLAGGTLLGGELSLAPSSAPPASRGFVSLDLDPRQLFDLVVAAPLLWGANLVTIHPGALDARLLIKRGSRTLGSFKVSAEAAMATAVRLARAADIDLLALAAIAVDASAPGASRRMKVRAGADSGELLISVTARSEGLAVEVRPTQVNGRTPEVRRRAELQRCSKCAALQPSSRARCEFDGGELLEVVDQPSPGGYVGAYRLGEPLGEGGMGVVLAAEHAFLGRRAAVKLLHRTMDQDPLAGRRFLAEARAASAISHPSIVDVFDYGLLADGRPYLVMERVDGESLEKRLDRVKFMEPAVALALVREIAVALAAAHEGGIAHLDLKPANVLLLPEGEAGDERPRIKLIDFGSAVSPGHVPLDGVYTGTPAYMSPEHARGEPVDHRSDLYSLGVVLYETLSGAVPFEYPDVWRVFRAHMLDPAPAVVSPLGPLPEVVVSLVARALKKRPEERHQSAAEFIADVDAALRTLRRSSWLRWLP